MNAMLVRDKRARVEREEFGPSAPAANIANMIPITKLIIIYSESHSFHYYVISLF